MVTPLFETLCRHFPKLVPRVFAQNTRVLLERLVSGSIVAGVLLCSEGDDPPDTLMAEVVGKLPYILVGSQKNSFRPSIDDCGSGTATMDRWHGTLRSSLLSRSDLQESRYVASDHGGDRE